MKSSPSVLVVDDDTDFNRTIVDVLQSRGYLVYSASCAADALAAVKHEPFDLVLLDLKLPDMDGLELLGRVRAVLPEVPVIVFTGFATVETAVRAMQQGAAEYLEKPCRADRLFVAIERELVRRPPPVTSGTDATRLNATESPALEDPRGLYFEAIFDSLAAGVMIVDSSYVIQQVNPAFARQYRLPAEALASRHCHEVIHHRNRPCHNYGEVCPIRSCLATGTTCRVQHHRIVPDGRTRYIENTMTPLKDRNGTIVSFVAVYTDLTDIKASQEESEKKSQELARLNIELDQQRRECAGQAEELARKNGELIRADAAKDEFLSTVSHELRTPLTSIIESINLVCDGTLGSVSERQSRFLEVALRNARRLGDIINDLLDISKIEAGRMTSRPVACDLTALLADAAASFGPVARRKSVALEYLRPGSPVEVFADPHLVRRAVYNLVSNAVKFTDQGRISLACRTKETEGHVTVSDTGTGIPAEEQARVFERFHQAHHGTNRPVGTGLGLSLTREMVLLNRGRIWFKSTEGKGTTFHIAFPLDRPEARLAWLLGQSFDGRTERIYLVSSRSGRGVSAFTDEICRLAGRVGRHALGCFLGTPPVVAVIVPGTEEDPCAISQRIAQGIADSSPETRLDVQALNLAETAVPGDSKAAGTLAALLAAITEMTSAPADGQTGAHDA